MTIEEAERIMKERPEIRELFVVIKKALDACKNREERRRLLSRIMALLEDSCSRGE